MSAPTLAPQTQHAAAFLEAVKTQDPFAARKSFEAGVHGKIEEMIQSLRPQIAQRYLNDVGGVKITAA